MIVEARDNLTEMMLGQKLMNSSYITPFVAHCPMPALERTPQHVFVGLVCEAGTYSPYLCPSDYRHYNFPSIKEFLHRRADLRDFLGRLGGKILVCDCNFSASSCWARLLQSAFCEIFGTTLGTDVIDDYIDNASTEMNSPHTTLIFWLGASSRLVVVHRNLFVMVFYLMNTFNKLWSRNIPLSRHPHLRLPCCVVWLGPLTILMNKFDAEKLLLTSLRS